MGRLLRMLGLALTAVLAARALALPSRLSVASLGDGVRWCGRFLENASGAFEAP